MANSPGQRILNDAGARMPELRLDPPVPIVACIVWEHDGEEHIETEAAGWSGHLVYLPRARPALQAHLGVARRGGRQATLGTVCPGSL